MTTGLRLTGNRDLAAVYRGEAARLMYFLNTRLDLGGIPSGKIERTMPDGTRITVLKQFRNNIILIDSPFPVSAGQEEKKLYYLRCGYLISEVQPEHEYRFNEIEGITIPYSLDEMAVDGTDSEILQSWYFAKNTRHHKRGDDGRIIYFPEYPNETFNSGTVDTPHETANWNAYHTAAYFVKWLEAIAVESLNVQTEDLSLWDVPTGLGTRTYTYTNTYKITYTDAGGAHTILGFMVSANSGSITRAKTISGDGYFFLDSSFSSSQTANRPTISTPTALGNLLTLRVAKNLTSAASGDIDAAWTFDHYDAGLNRDIYSIDWTGSQTREISGPVSLYVGSVLIDTAQIAIGHDDTIADTTGGYQQYNEPGHVPQNAVLTAPEMSQVYDRDEYAFSVTNWTNIEDQVFALVYQKIHYDESWTRVDKMGALPGSVEAYLQLWQADGDIARYMQLSEITPFPAPTGSDSYSRTDTTDYYLSWRSKAGTLEKVLLATQTRTYTGRTTSTLSGQYVTGTVMNVTKNFILYAYQIYNSSDDTLVSTNFGVIDINTGERNEFVYTPEETAYLEFWGDKYYYSPTFYMYIPKDETKQPPEV